MLVVVSAWRWRAAATPAATATATTAAYLLGGGFVLPWYPAWALPAAALDPGSWLARLVAVQAAFLVAVYEFELPAHVTLAGPGAVIRTITIVIVAFGALALFVDRLVRSPATEDPERGNRISTTTVVLLE